MISFFDNGLWVDGADYGYTPESRRTEIQKSIENVQITNEETGEVTIEQKEVESEVEIVTPAIGRADCIHVEYQEIPAGKTPVLHQTKKGFEVEFIEIAPPTLQDN